MWWLPIAGSIVGNLLSNNNKQSQQSQQPSVPERMDFGDAYSQAESVLTPQFERHQSNVMGQIDNNLIGRGFYGQAPGDAMKAGVMTDMSRDFQSQLANYATNLQNQQFGQDYQTYQLNLRNQEREQDRSNNFWGGVGSIAGSFLGGAGGEALLTNWLTN